MFRSLIDFLRRLFIIVLEDSILHPGLALLSWLTQACGKRTGFVPSLQHVDCMLQMVHDIAAVSVKDGLLPTEGGSANMQPPAPASAEETNHEEEEQKSQHYISTAGGAAAAAAVHSFPAGGVRSSSSSFCPDSLPAPSLLSPLEDLSSEQRCLVKCILARACMGGSPWDMAMLRSYAHLWNKRFQAENWARKQSAAANINSTNSPSTAALLSPSSDSGSGSSWLSFLGSLYSPALCAVPPSLCLAPPISLASVGYIQDDDLVLSAVDHHCSPIVSLPPTLRRRRNQPAHRPQRSQTECLFASPFLFAVCRWIDCWKPADLAS